MGSNDVVMTRRWPCWIGNSLVKSKNAGENVKKLTKTNIIKENLNDRKPLKIPWESISVISNV